MAEILTIPQKLAQKGDLVIVPRVDYEEALKVKQRLLWEEKDTDEAVHIFDREHKTKKLKRAVRFFEILDTRSR
ncbi:MAG: hypothetical protein HYT98_00640 [Candidatus Sungbacteria bacterium]|nr:hypothetical protein [Candidatus Sungbacteria bacterium]